MAHKTEEANITSSRITRRSDHQEASPTEAIGQGSREQQQGGDGQKIARERPLKG
jgi:hypothetical protein